ncbi:NAD(P)H-dependent flavin oxidoreductase [Microbacterium sp. A93]|uniref:NAD(P)H-dependent flavin oxidoreductase n=1 Tax=Microbacterium sp. A93 TaxID=3450716 RepID=UPI003F426C29
MLGAPMFLVSGPKLVLAQCRAGIIGAYPALNSRPAAQLSQDLKHIIDGRDTYDAVHPDSPSAAFAVNLIAHASNARLQEDLETCVEFEVPIVITSLGVRAEVNAAVQSYGGVVLHDVTNNRHARKAIEQGADGVIAVAAGAGGHAGAQSPFALTQEIREWFDGPLVLGGAISTGRAVAAAQTLGADLAYVGTPFIATHESSASAAYKAMVVDGSAEDIVYTDAFTGVNANWLRESIIASGVAPQELPHMARGTIQVNRDEEQRAWRDVWSGGQGIGAVDEIVTVAHLVQRLREQYGRAEGRDVK